MSSVTTCVKSFWFAGGGACRVEPLLIERVIRRELERAGRRGTETPFEWPTCAKNRSAPATYMAVRLVAMSASRGSARLASSDGIMGPAVEERALSVISAIESASTRTFHLP